MKANNTVTVFEYRLNFRREEHSSYWNMTDVLNLFETHAMQMRDAIPGSPRWKYGKETTVETEVPYRCPFILHDITSNYCVMFERFSEDEIKKDIIPKNLFASRQLGKDFYGIVLVFRVISPVGNIRSTIIDIDFVDFLEKSETEKNLKKELASCKLVKSYSFTSAVEPS